MFAPKIFVVLHFTSRSIIYAELIFVYGMRSRERFIHFVYGFLIVPIPFVEENIAPLF